MSLQNYDDVGDAIREGRALREASTYRIRFGLEGLTFRNIDVPDPVPTAPAANKAALDSEIDSVLDEIDTLLESNAEEFVRGFVQKGGQ